MKRLIEIFLYISQIIYFLLFTKTDGENSYLFLGYSLIFIFFKIIDKEETKPDVLGTILIILFSIYIFNDHNFIMLISLIIVNLGYVLKIIIPLAFSKKGVGNSQKDCK